MLTAHVNDSSMVDDIDNTDFDQTIVNFVDEMDKWIIVFFNLKISKYK